MPHLLHVYALPTMVTPGELAGGTAVVIDVLRASTTIIHALEAGASEIIPCLGVEEARTRAAEWPQDRVILGGERQGLPIEGFDLGNSPREYRPDRVGGRAVIFTTTNGTRALWQARMARRVLIGAFVNASAVCRRLVGAREIHLLCAGTRGRQGRDDILLAGLLIERLHREGGVPYQLDAQARAAREGWARSFARAALTAAAPPDPNVLAEALRNTAGGRNLVATGQEDDILAAAQIDRFDSVPELDPQTLRIRLP